MKNTVFCGKIFFTVLVLFICLLSVNQASSQFQKFTVSGSVVDSVTRLPVQASILIYSPVKNSYDKTATDSAGKYSIELTGGIDYKFEAYPWSNDYDARYYDNAENFADATPVTLDKDYSNISFSLIKKHVFDNGLHGIVKNIRGEAVLAIVFVRPVNRPNSFQYSAILDHINTGVFSISNLPPGQYILYAIPNESDLSDGYFKENDIAVASPDNATVFTIKESGINSEDYLIILPDKNKPDPEYTFEIKGIITDENNKSLQDVNISIVSSGGKDITSGQDVKTDPTGEFVFFFKAAGADKYLLTATKDGYSDTYFSFYLDENTPGTAAFLPMTKIDNIKYNNGIKGLVKDSAGNGIMSKVTVVRVLDDGTFDFNNSEKTVSTNPDNPGEFLIKSLKPGNYVIYASPGVNGLISGYYSAGKNASIDINAATIVNVSETGVNTDNYVIILPEKQIYIDPNLRYQLFGYVFDDNNNPIQDVVITAIDANGNDVIVNQENVTDKSGMFHIVFSSPGTFYIKAEKDGYIDASGTITFDNSMPDQKTIIIMPVKTLQNQGQKDSKIMAGVSDNNLNDNILMFPNPVKSILNFNAGLQSGRIDITVYNVSGQNVLSLSNCTDASNSILMLNVSSLQSGSYIARIFVNGKESGSKIFIKE